MKQQKVQKSDDPPTETLSNNSVEHIAKQSHLIESQTSEDLDGTLTDHLFVVSIPDHNTLDLQIEDDGSLYLQIAEDDEKKDRETMEHLLDTVMAYSKDNLNEVTDPIVTHIDDIIYKKSSMSCYIPVHDESNKDPIYRETLLQLEEYVELSSSDLLKPVYCKLDSFSSDVDMIPDMNSNQEFSKISVTFTISDDRTVTITPAPKRNQMQQPNTLKTKFLNKLQTYNIDIRQAKRISLGITRAIWMLAIVFGTVLLLSPLATAGLILTISILGLIAFKVAYNLSQGPWKIENESPESLTSLDIHQKLPSNKSEIISSSQLISDDSAESELQTVQISTDQNRVVFTSTTDETRTWELSLENGFLSSELTALFYELGYENLDDGIVTIRITPDQQTETEPAVQTESGEWIHPVR
jgi:hypothetical protein